MLRSLAFVVVIPLLAGARTVDHYPVANGFSAAAVRLSDGRLDSFRPHIYQRVDASTAVPELLFDAYFGARASSVSTWLTDIAIDAHTTESDANALVTTQRVVAGANPLRIETTWLAPFGLARPAAMAIVTVTNDGATTAADVSFPSIANFHLGSGADNTVSESATYDAATDSITESGARGSIVALALAPSVNHTMTPSDPYPLVRDGLALPTVDSSGTRDNVVTSFTFAPSGGSLAAGASFAFGVLYVHTSGSATSARSDALAYIAGRSASAVLADELAASRAFVASATAPDGMSAAERALWGAQLALLRAAQVREAGAPRGQIVASLPTGIWNITWVRDATYAIRGLAAAGKPDEARAGLEFMLNGDAGGYASYVGRDYAISVVRYFGDGTEESDTNASGPNVEWDGFGLFLLAYADAARAGAALDDAATVALVKSDVADVIVSLVDAPSGLLIADSSIWETHWDPSGESVGRRQYLYSSATACAGLRAFAALLTELDASDPDAPGYAALADDIANAIVAELVNDDGALAASVEEVGGADRDAAVVEALNLDVVAADSEVARDTLAHLAGLRAATPGYFRTDEGGYYDSQEWLVVDLWLARAHRRVNTPAGADESERLLAHVTQTGSDNLGLIPELLDVTTGAAAGAWPMLGFGAGAYLSALADRARDDAAGEGEGEGEGEAGEGEGEGEAGEGEGDPSEGEGEGDASEGEGEGEGEGDASEGDASDGEDGAVQRESCTCAGAPTVALWCALATVVRPRRSRSSTR